ncbi:MAG: A/G-specific adenine glycosylase [Cyclobacteriaceae bacterium]
MAAAEKKFVIAISEWFESNRRDLPWRNTKDPYKIWVSEIILQQTRVDQGLPYFNRFIKKFPNVKSLASAHEDQVLRLWQGLGYYSRARNMHRCAIKILEMHHGKVPSAHAELVKLPGIGPYTAAAVSSISVGEPMPVIDGNVFRVLSRVFGIDTPINGSSAKKIFNVKAAVLMQEAVKEKIFPGDYNQAIMEFGALQCIPANPDCKQCPLSRMCRARALGTQALLPAKLPKAPKKERFINYLILKFDNRVWMKKRQPGDVWEGLFDFLETETTKASGIKVLTKKFQTITGIPLGIRVAHYLKHVLTHQKLHIRFFITDLNALPEKKLPAVGSFVTIQQAFRLPKPVFLDSVLRKLKEK